MQIDVDRTKLAEFCRQHHIRKLAFLGSVLTDDFGPESDVDGLRVTVWGTVMEGSIFSNSYFVTDGSDLNGIKVVTPGTPAVAEGEFVTVTGAAGYNGGRAIYE